MTSLTTASHETVTVQLTHEQVAQLLASQAPAEPAAPVDKYETAGEFMPVPKAVIAPKIAAYLEAKKLLDEAKAALADAEKAITDEFDMHEVLILEGTDQVIAEWRVVTAQVLDTAKLKAEHPDLALKYQKARRSRGLRLV